MTYGCIRYMGAATGVNFASVNPGGGQINERRVVNVHHCDEGVETSNIELGARGRLIRPACYPVIDAHDSSTDIIRARLLMISAMMTL
jgi:hypothetical protein